jgi:hypothetical protein
MRDSDVRKALHARLAIIHADELSQTLVVDELGLCGEVRVDVAVINGDLSGFEIKSARDNLRRLPKQVEFYSRVMDFAGIVVAKNHLSEARSMLPKWWGIQVAADAGDGQVVIKHVRAPRRNRQVDPASVVQLLWRDEALEELALRDADRGVRGGTRSAVWARLVEVTSSEELQEIVRGRLKARTTWRVGERSKLGA